MSAPALPREEERSAMTPTLREGLARTFLAAALAFGTTVPQAALALDGAEVQTPLASF